MSVRSFMEAMMTGKLKEQDVMDYLVELKQRGETAQDILEAAQVMRAHACRISVDTPLLDTCGTGGDGHASLNISTLVALILASDHVAVAKHGNRSVSSQCGSADLLEALGVNITLSPEQVKHSIETVQFGFMFAPQFHPAMRYAAPARRKLKTRTIFNCIGPLTNPAGARHQLLGVYSRELLEPVCAAAGKLGCEHVIVVHGDDGLDEVTLSGPTHVAEWMNGNLKQYTVHPDHYGLARYPLSALHCKDQASALKAALTVLDGAAGPHLDVVLLNAAFAYRAANSENDIKAGIARAHQQIEKGRVKSHLKKIIQASQT